MSENFWRRLSNVFGLMSIGILAGLIVFAANVEIKDLDLWLHIAMGRFIIHNGYVPDVDVLSCSIAGKPWVNHEWLFQVLVYLVHLNWGPDGLLTMQAIVVGLTFMFLLFLGYSRERQLGVVFLLLLVFLVYEFRFTIRPDIFSLLFFTLYIYILSLYIDRRWTIPALFLIQVLWSNFHGFFFFGPLIVLIGIMTEAIKRHVKLPYEWNSAGRLEDDEYRRLKWIFAAVIVACLFNPLTFRGAWYPIGVFLGLGGENKIFFSYIQELQRPITRESLFTPYYSYYKALIIISFVSFIYNRRKIDIGTFFFWLLFLAFSLAAVRNVVFFAFVAYFICLSNVIGMSFDDVVPIRFKDKKFTYLTTIMAQLILMLWMINYGTEVSYRGYFDFDKFERKSDIGGVTQRSYPDKAADFLVENKVKGNFYNDFNSGAYLLGRCYPDIKVSMDGRTEVYGADFFLNVYERIWKEGDDALLQKALDKFHITGALLNSVHKPIPDGVLVNFFKRKDWVLVYLNYDAVIFLKDVPENKKVIDQYRLDLSKWQVKKMDLLKLGSVQVLPYQPVNRAYTLLSLGFDDAAMAEAQDALLTSPGYAEPYKILGKIYGKRNEHQKAFENFRIATMISPGEAETRYNLALAYDNLGEMKYAIKQYERLLNDSPDQPKAYFFLSRAFAKDKQYDRALKMLRQGHQLNKEDVIDLIKIGDVFYDQKEYNSAREVYSLGFNTKKDLAKVNYKLGLCYLELGEKEEARKAFEAGLAIEPENEDLKKGIEKLKESVPAAK